MRKNLFTALLGIGLCLIGGMAFAKAYFAPFEDMIKSADAIAIIKIVQLQAQDPKQEAAAVKDLVATIEVKETILGDLSGVNTIVIPSFFPCAVVPVEPGEYLVFLEIRDGTFTNSNWHLSLRKVTGDQVELFTDDMRDMAWDLTTARRHIKMTRDIPLEPAPK